ncbi:MAG TPA: LytTR family DNA-binding domain-containing protein [Cellvibrionaceae bacterium]
MHVLVVDDELLARQRAMRMIESLDDYEVVGEAGNGQAALAAIADLDPDIVLLDIRMPGEDGLEAARKIAEMEEPPAIIFCTAYDEYALEAFSTLAVGYLLKPLQKDALRNALEKARRLNKLQRLELPESEAAPREAARKHIAAKTRRGVELILIDDISSFVADQKYVTVRHKGMETLIDDTLKDLEDEFAGRFIRIHRNCLVAIHLIEKLERISGGQYELQLKDTHYRPVVSRRHVAGVKELLSNL